MTRDIIVGADPPRIPPGPRYVSSSPAASCSATAHLAAVLTKPTPAS